MMSASVRPCSRILVAVLLTASLLGAQQQGKEPKPPSDNPPVGTGKLLLVEDFESTEVGQIPEDYLKAGMVGVVDDVAHSGKKSLRIEAAVNGPRRITYKGGVLAQLGGQHWGRLYFKVQQPCPEPAAGVIHSTLVAGSATSPAHKDPIEVRLVDTVMGQKGSLQYLYNVQPGNRGEFGKGSSYKYKFTDDWTLAEWYVDFATQTYRLFLGGVEVKEVAFMKGPGKFDNAEIPEVFDSISFGWNNYQQAGKGFVAWIDDVALAKDRIGARGTLPPKKKP